MGHIHRADEIHLQHAGPVGRFEIPKRKPEFARANAHTEDHMVRLRHGIGKLAHLIQTGHITLIKRAHACRWAGLHVVIKAMNLAAFRHKALGNGAANAPGSTDDGDGLACEMKIHEHDYVTTLLQEKHTMKAVASSFTTRWPKEQTTKDMVTDAG